MKKPLKMSQFVVMNNFTYFDLKRVINLKDGNILGAKLISKSEYFIFISVLLAFWLQLI